MGREDQEVRKNLGGLAAVRDLGHAHDVQTAMADYARSRKPGAHPGALAREHERPIHCYVSRPKAQDDVGVSGLPVRSAAGHSGGAQWGR